MNIVIVGMGEVGRYITDVLVSEGHNIVVIDLDRERLNSVEESLDVMSLNGHAGSEKTLKEARIETADLFIAVTDNSEVNMLSAIRAKELGATITIARVANPEYFDGEQAIIHNIMGIDLVVNPQALVAMEMHKIIRSANAIAIQDFADNRIEMIQLPVDYKSKSVVDHFLKDLKMPENTLIAAIIRENEIMVPGGMDQLESGDEVMVVGKIEQIPAVEKLFGQQRRRFTKRVFMVGGTEIGRKLATMLARDGIEVVLFEKDRARCVELSETLPQSVVIINGDGTDVDQLEEERADNADVIVAVSPEDEVNIMTGLLAKQIGAPRIVAVVHKPDYAKVCERLGFDATLSPRREVAKHVLKWVRMGEVVEVSPVLDGKGEFLEFIVPKQARIVGEAIAKVGFPKGANICAIVSGDRAFVPRGNDVIHENDRVIVFTTPKIRKEVEKAFQKKTIFSHLIG